MPSMHSATKRWLLVSSLTAGLSAELPDAVHHFRIRERGHIARVLLVRDRRQYAAHDLARARLRHVGHDDHLARPRDGADFGDDRSGDLLRNLVRSGQPGLQRDVEIRYLA